MSNPYYQLTPRFPRRITARAEEVNAQFDAVEAGFDQLPAPRDLRDGTSALASAVTGGPAAYLLTLPADVNSYRVGMTVLFVPAVTNTGAVTVNVNDLGVRAVLQVDGGALTGGEIVAGSVHHIYYDGTTFRLNVRSAMAVAAAASASEAAAQVTLAIAEADRAESEADRAEAAELSAQTAAAAAASAAGLPSLTGQALKVLAVNSAADGVEWADGIRSGYQEFLSSGTWTKPVGALWVRVEVIAGGGGGGRASGGNRAGGSGGEGFRDIFRAADLPASVTVTVGAGGAGRDTDGTGNNGGDSSFGSVVVALGGIGGVTTGTTPVPRQGLVSNATTHVFPQAGAGGVSNNDGGSTIYGGAGGGGDTGAGGVSAFGGDGGAGSAAGTADSGAVPGGGGGASGTGTSGAGGAGRVRVWWW